MSCATGKVRELALNNGGTGILISGDGFIQSADGEVLDAGTYIYRRRPEGKTILARSAYNDAQIDYMLEIKTRLATRRIDLDEAERNASSSVVQEGIWMRNGWDEYKPGQPPQPFPSFPEYAKQKNGISNYADNLRLYAQYRGLVYHAICVGDLTEEAGMAVINDPQFVRFAMRDYWLSQAHIMPLKQFLRVIKRYSADRPAQLREAHRRQVESALQHNLPLYSGAKGDYPDLEIINPLADRKPWMMSLEEWAALEPEVANPEFLSQGFKDYHRAYVKAALESGEPVPFEARLSYPDLLAQYGMD